MGTSKVANTNNAPPKEMTVKEATDRIATKHVENIAIKKITAALQKATQAYNKEK